MDCGTRPRKNISTDELLKIASRVRICSYSGNSIR